MSFWGEIDCPTCFQFFSLAARPELCLTVLPFNLSHTRCHKRIGPHDFQVLSIIFGSLLGDGYAENHGNGTRIQFSQEASHIDYLLWLYSFMATLGYTSDIQPKVLTRLGKYGKLRNYIRFSTFTYSSFNWIHNCWYKPSNNGYTKILPASIDQYLTPLALAIWIMDDGGKVSSGLKLATNNFLLSEVQILSSLLNRIYDLDSSINSAGVPNQYVIYVPKKSMSKLLNIIRPHLHPSMNYKLIHSGKLHCNI
jgi:ubiquinol-cytochrome c reductase cytochrome b subunit